MLRTSIHRLFKRKGGVCTNTTPASREAIYSIASSLPSELLLAIFDRLLPFEMELPLSHPVFNLQRKTMPDLCNAARVCRSWVECAQAVIFRYIFLDTDVKRILFNQVIDPKTKRGRLLGELAANLTVVHWGFVPQQSRSAGLWRLLNRRSEPAVNDICQIIQRCPNLRTLRFEHTQYWHTPPDSLELWIDDQLTPSPNLRKLEISLTEWTCCVPSRNHYASPAVYRLIINSPSITTLYLETRFDPTRSPPVPPLSQLSPSFQLKKFSAYQYDALTQWVLHYSKDSLKDLALVYPTNLRQLGREFPNVTTLTLEEITEGDSVEEFAALETLNWTSTGRKQCTSFLNRLPGSIRCITFCSANLAPVFRALLASGTLPNLRTVMLNQSVYMWGRRSPWNMQELAMDALDLEQE